MQHEVFVLVLKKYHLHAHVHHVGLQCTLTIEPRITYVYHFHLTYPENKFLFEKYL